MEAVKKTEALATPSSQTDGSRLNTTRDRDVSRDYSREMSVESNTSSRGAAPDDSETRCVGQSLKHVSQIRYVDVGSVVF